MRQCNNLKAERNVSSQTHAAARAATPRTHQTQQHLTLVSIR